MSAFLLFRGCGGCGSLGFWTSAEPAKSLKSFGGSLFAEVVRRLRKSARKSLILYAEVGLAEVGAEVSTLKGKAWGLWEAPRRQPLGRCSEIGRPNQR